MCTFSAQVCAFSKYMYIFRTGVCILHIAVHSAQGRMFSIGMHFSKWVYVPHRFVHSPERCRNFPQVRTFSREVTFSTLTPNSIMRAKRNSGLGLIYSLTFSTGVYVLRIREPNHLIHPTKPNTRLGLIYSLSGPIEWLIDHNRHLPSSVDLLIDILPRAGCMFSKSGNLIT